MAAYEILLLNTAIPQIQAAQSGDTYVVPRDIAFSAALTLSAGTANGVPYLNASKVLTTGSALTFDGTDIRMPNGGSILVGASASGASLIAINGTAAAQRIVLGTSGTDGVINVTRTSGVTPNLIFQQESGELMRLTSTGLGIGANNPAYKLDVNGNVNIGSTSSADTALFVKSSTVTGLVGAQSNYSAWSSGGLTTAMNIGTTTNNGISFGTNNIGRLNLDASGNLGLGVTPSAWATSFGIKAFDISGGSVYAASTDVNLVLNAYFNSNFNWVYKTTNPASLYQCSSGSHTWYTAPSGFGYGTAATSLTATQNGNSYTIVTAGTTDFTLIGAANNNVGTTFTKSGGTGAGTGTVSQNISFTQAMTLDASGNLGVGPTNPSAYGKLAVDGNISLVSYTQTMFANKFQIVSSSGDMEFLGGSSNILFKTGVSNTERARITSGGYFKASNDGTYVNSTGNFHELRTSANDTQTTTFSHTAASPYGIIIRYTAASPNNTDNWFWYCDDGGATQRASLKSNGGLYNYQANDSNLSDRREKTNFAPAKSYLDTICAIPVQTFNYIDQSEDDPGLTLGVVAQDVQAVAPELVTESNWGTKDDPKMRLSIYQTDLQYALMKCIQELKSELDSVKAELVTLKGA